VKTIGASKMLGLFAKKVSRCHLEGRVHTYRIISESWTGVAEVRDGKIVHCSTPISMAIPYPQRTEEVLRRMCVRHRWTIDDITQTPGEELAQDLFGALRYLLAVHCGEGGAEDLALSMARNALAKAEGLRKEQASALDTHIQLQRAGMETAHLWHRRRTLQAQ
jgi:hypothetical protein